MKLLVLSTAPLISFNNSWKAYSPYAEEMKFWAKHAEAIQFCCPIWDTDRELLVKTLEFETERPIELIEFEITSLFKVFQSFYAVFVNSIRIFKAMQKADHIHLRCPGNIGLLACIIQVFFSSKLKTAKYAGNWDPKAKQPLSYKLQKWILSNTFLTKNISVLVYGEWPNQTKNIKPFFTASYTEKEKKPMVETNLNTTIELLFVGTLSKGKMPLYTVQLVENLFRNGYDVRLKIYGEGSERRNIEDYLQKHNLNHLVVLMGNRPKEEVVNAYKESHFLILPSQSEGWPKVVAEAMFWGCLPVSSSVSCVPSMLGGGERGILLRMRIDKDSKSIMDLIDNPDKYHEKTSQAVVWSRKYTLDYFENEIKQLLK